MARREGWGTALHLQNVCPALCGLVKGRAISLQGGGAQRGGEAAGLTLTHRMCGSNFPLKSSRAGRSLRRERGAEDTHFPPCSIIQPSTHSQRQSHSLGPTPGNPTLSPQGPSLFAASSLLSSLLGSPSPLEEGQVSASKSIPVTWPRPAPAPSALTSRLWVCRLSFLRRTGQRTPPRTPEPDLSFQPGCSGLMLSVLHPREPLVLCLIRCLAHLTLWFRCLSVTQGYGLCPLSST